MLHVAHHWCFLVQHKIKFIQYAQKPTSSQFSTHKVNEKVSMQTCHIVSGDEKITNQISMPYQNQKL